MSMDTEVFVYTGLQGGGVRIDPSVTPIPDEAFYERKKLTEVELCEGIVEIGERSFGWCGNSITKIIIPTSLQKINNWLL